MRFVAAFLKVADNAASGGHNNQGLEFHTSEGENPVYGASPGGMAPSGLPSYGPQGGAAQQGKPPKQRLKELSRMVAMGKTAACDGVGTASQGAGTLATQLKWETTGSDVPENMGYNAESSTRMKAYLKAARTSRSMK